MGKGKNKGSKAEPVVDQTEVEETEETTEEAKAPKGNPMERIAQRGHDKKNLQPNWLAFQQYVLDHGGPSIKPEHIGVVLTGYKHYQKSDHAVAARNEVSTRVAQTREQKEAAKAEKAKAAAARQQEQAEAKAAKEKTASKAGKTAAAASKPSKKVAASSSATKAPATKAAPAKKATPAKKVAAKKAPAKKATTRRGAKAPY